MKKVEVGDFVSIVYEGLLDNNEVFESSENTGPLEFTVGAGSVLPGFENAVVGMTEGLKKTITLSPAEAYGEKRKELVHVVKKTVFGESITPKPGMVLGMTIDKEGEKHKVPVLILEVNGEDITIDFNHPLAGQSLTYEITVQSIQKKSDK